VLVYVVMYVWLVLSTLIVVCSVRSTVGFGALLGAARIGWNCQAVDAKIVANARDHEMRPLSVDNGGEDEVSAKIPKLKVG